MNNRLIIIGAGGHGKVVADCAVKCGYTDIYFVDDRMNGECLGFPIVGVTADLETLDDGRTDFVIAIGSNHARKTIAEKFDLNWATLVHPAAQIAIGTLLGEGTVILASAVVNACAVVGKHCIVNTAAVVEHDNVVGDYAHISPRAALGGTVRIGEQTHIGIGAAVRNNIEICDNCVVGAGAVVVKNIDCSGTYMGVPAKGKL